MSLASTERELGRFVIDMRVPSANVLMRKYKHPGAYKRLRDQLESWVMVGMTNARIPKARGRRRLYITRFVKNKRYLLDRGNLVAGCKPLLDACTRQGLIVDDREELLDDVYVQEVDSKHERTEVVVVALEEQ